MVFYSFYTEPDKVNLVYRTNEGWSEFKQDLMMFADKQQAQSDFFKILFDNEEFRQGEYFDTAKKEKKTKVVKEKESSVDRVEPDRNQSASTVPLDFKIELNKVYHMKAELFMAQLPDKYVDYVFTSPPYNVGERIAFGKNNKIYEGDTGMYDDYEDAMTPEAYEAQLFEWIDGMIRVTKKHVFMNIQMLAKNKLTIFEIFNRYKYYIKDVIIWEKTIASPNINKHIMTSAYEYIFIFSNDKPHLRSFDDLIKPAFRNVIRGVNSSQNKYRKLNKATFPLYLPRTVIQSFGKQGDVWYDPFNGTGTTFHACEIEGRNYIGSELDIDQVNSSNARIWDEKSQTKIDFSAGSFLAEVEENSEEKIKEELPKQSLFNFSVEGEPGDDWK